MAQTRVLMWVSGLQGRLRLRRYPASLAAFTVLRGSTEFELGGKVAKYDTRILARNTVVEGGVLCAVR